MKVKQKQTVILFDPLDVNLELICNEINQMHYFDVGEGWEGRIKNLGVMKRHLTLLFMSVYSIFHLIKILFDLRSDV